MSERERPISQFEVDMHNRFCHPKNPYRWLGNPYTGTSPTRELFECKFCGIQFLRLSWYRRKGEKPNEIIRPFENYLHDTI